MQRLFTKINTASISISKSPNGIPTQADTKRLLSPPQTQVLDTVFRAMPKGTVTKTCIVPHIFLNICSKKTLSGNGPTQ